MITPHPRWVNIESASTATQALVTRVEPAIAAVQALLPVGFPERTAQTIFEGLRLQVSTWNTGLPSLA